MAINGWTATGFEGVRDQFEKNFADGLEVGAAFSAYHRGQKVVDLWGGIADVGDRTAVGGGHDHRRVLDDEGRDGDLREPPGPGRSARRRTHRSPSTGPSSRRRARRASRSTTCSRIAPGWRGSTSQLTLEDALAWEPMIHALEHQAPVWEPGTAHGYHAVTYGYLVGEVVRRISGKSIGTYFRDEIAEPLGLDFWIGLPEALEPRVAPLIGGLGASIRSERRRP